MMRYVILIAIGLVASEVTAAPKDLRFDQQRGVLGSTQAKRAWLGRAMDASIQDARQLDVARTRLAAMKSREISALANHLFARQLRHARAHGHLGRHPWNGGGVGFAPVITWLPEGVNMGAAAVVSPDRRHVRISTTPVFSSIPYVDTFNFHTGRTTRQYSPQRPLGWNHMPPPPPTHRVKTWHDGMRTRTGPRPSHHR